MELFGKKKILSKSKFKQIFFALIILPPLIVLVIPETREAAYYGIFSLDSYENTADDYKDEAIDMKVYWGMNACDGGQCLLRVDWHYGFANGSERVVNSCIMDELERADIEIKLDTVRTKCGRKHMKFAGELYA